MATLEEYCKFPKLPIPSEKVVGLPGISQEDCLKQIFNLEATDSLIYY
jgi:hypothetical protein